MYTKDFLARMYFSEDPFRFGTVEDFFLPEFLEEMELRLKGLVKDFFPSKVDSPLMTFPMRALPDAGFWDRLEEVLVARDLSMQLYRKFDVGWGEEFFVKKGLSLHVESGSPFLSPHTDSCMDVDRSVTGCLKPCVFSMQFYLPVDLSDESLGTRLYERDPRNRYVEKIHIPYRRNLAFAFRPDSLSFHGFPRFELGSRFRLSLVMRHNLYPMDALPALKNKMPSRIQETVD